MKYSIKPTSLVMRQLKCFYCSETSCSDMYAAHGMFGIRHCENHKDAACRDIHAYYHETEQIDMNDLRERADIDRFDNSVYIQRSNGDIDFGWTIRKSSMTFPLLMSKINGSWCLPMQNVSGLTKNVPLISFTTDELATMNTFAANDIHRLIQILDDGVYKADYIVVQQLEAKSIEEIAGISAVNVNGNVVRLFIPV